MKKLLFLLSVMVLMSCSEKAAKDQGASFENESKGSAIDKLVAERSGKTVLLYSNHLKEKDSKENITTIGIELNENVVSLNFLFKRKTSDPVYLSRSILLLNEEKSSVLLSLEGLNYEISSYENYYALTSTEPYDYFYNIDGEFEYISYERIADINALRDFIYGESPKVKLVGKNTAIIPLTKKEIKAMKEVLAGYDELKLKMQEKSERQAMEGVKERYY